MSANPTTAKLLADLSAALLLWDPKPEIRRIAAAAETLARAEAGVAPLPPAVDPRFTACVEAVRSIDALRQIHPMGQLAEEIARAVLRAWLQQQPSVAMLACGNAMVGYSGKPTEECPSPARQAYGAMNRQAAHELGLLP